MQITDLVYIDSAGYHFKDYPSFLLFLQQKYQGVYGTDVVLTPDSQDGQFLAILAQCFFDLASIGGSVYNSFSPATAQGAGLARLVKINGITKGVSTNSTADLTIVGQAGTIITNGIAQDALGQKWDLPSPVTIPLGGSIVVTAMAEVTGAITADAGTISKIFTPTLGWQTVTNVAAATPGAPVESDAQLRVRQATSTANPSLTVFEGTRGAVENLVGVTKVQAYENARNTTDGNGIPPFNISIVAAGGDAQMIANTIALHKTPGVPTYGTTSETVYDNHGMPLTINFFRPTVASIKVQITITALKGYTSTFAAQIAAALAAVINAGDIGNTVLITKLFSPAYLLGTPADGTFDIDTLLIAKNAGAFGAVNIPLNFIEQPVCNPAVDVTVIVT